MFQHIANTEIINEVFYFFFFFKVCLQSSVWSLYCGIPKSGLSMLYDTGAMGG